MIQLQLYKTLWGHPGTFESACRQAVARGFAGIEGPAPMSVAEQAQWRQLLANYGLEFIAEICTAGSYVPDRGATVQDHLDSLAQKLEASIALAPRFVTCIGGCDAWEEQDSAEFFQRALALAERFDVVISFETHRARSLFNPWVTARLCKQVPAMKLTCDFSHWCVVTERLLDGEEDVLEAIRPHAFHIHARVGYDQGPQVPDPRAERYHDALSRHLEWWRQIWRQKLADNAAVVTMTPEFGPDGYQAIDVVSDKPVGDLWAFNSWMAELLQQQFGQLALKAFTQEVQVHE